MLTVFAVPKAFRGHIATIQRNAIGSWARLSPRCQVLLFGDEEGTAEAARKFGVCHVPGVATNEFGTPLLNDVFEKAQKLAAYDALCYVNGDIILMSDFVQAMDRVGWSHRRFLMIGRAWNVEVGEPLAFDTAQWEEHVRGLVSQKGTPRELFALDYFAFPYGFYRDLPPFALGRAGFDNWLIWKARALKATVVDAGAVVMAVHQEHDYSHVPGGKSWSYEGEEAIRNWELMGRPKRVYTTTEATHRLTPDGLRFKWWGYFLLRFPWESAKTHVGHWRRVVARLMNRWVWRLAEWTRPVRHLLGLRMTKVRRPGAGLTKET